MADKPYVKRVSTEALVRLLKNMYLQPKEHKAMVFDSLYQYVAYGYMETPGADHVPYRTAADLPRHAVDVFGDFLVDNGEDEEMARASMEAGWEEMAYTTGMKL